MRFFGMEGGTVAKNFLPERTTTRFVLSGGNGSEQAFYIKRHGSSPLKEYLKPLFRLTRPILGARNEWVAMIRFHEVGIPTMVPVALGERGKHSFVVTRSIEGCSKVSKWMQENLVRRQHCDRDEVRLMIQKAAEITRTMHSARMHHQDFYLTHLMVSGDSADRQMYVIDLGRVRQRRHLSQRWIVKDLAQLDYSASLLTKSERCRFFEAYLGHSLRDSDRGVLRRIQRKSAAIARHSRKNRL